MSILKRVPPLAKDLEDRIRRTGQTEDLKKFVITLVEKIQTTSEEKTQQHAATDQ